MLIDLPWGLWWQAVWIGLSIAAPVGPIGLLTIQRSLRQGAAAGLATGLGAALVDAVYGGVAAFDVAGVMAWLSAAGLGWQRLPALAGLADLGEHRRPKRPPSRRLQSTSCAALLAGSC